MNDLIERLRKFSLARSGELHRNTDATLADEAADEIERLRAIIKRAIELPHPSEMEEPGGLWHEMRHAVQQLMQRNKK